MYTFGVLLPADPAAGSTVVVDVVVDVAPAPGAEAEVVLWGGRDAGLAVEGVKVG